MLPAFYFMVFVVVDAMTCATKHAQPIPRDVSVYYSTPPQEDEMYGTAYVTSTIGMYECQRGYILSGARYIACFRNGNMDVWTSDPTSPSCTRSTGKQGSHLSSFLSLLSFFFFLIISKIYVMIFF